MADETDWEIFEARAKARLKWVPVPPGRVSSMEENEERFVMVDIEGAPRHYVATGMSFEDVSERFWFTPLGRHESNTEDVSDETSFNLDPRSRGAAGVGKMT